ncbi:hypothetical protein BDZ94DRAFT_1298990 [Collybia nuda]|uniref:Prolyl 4-hydroxylase alpha subunit Fe(2+) 2OG dioxygenase domain-containing protein n=1 Tax=Collybia nuda TaxID=64659 RepID=A0A9P5Y394_9AGAR|nr:hypothetical protein BDZ94DRAFT_1298990 [Collybia nuda]
MSDLKRAREISPKPSESESDPSLSEGDIPNTQKKTRQEPIQTRTEIHTTGELDGKVRTAIALNSAIKLASSQYKIPPIGYSLTTYEKQKPPSSKNQKILKDLRSIYEEVPLPYRHGSFEGPFHFTITRPDYKYEGEFGRKASINNNLEEWYEQGTVAGYGDMESLETKVDIKSVMQENPKLLECVRATWEEKFIPGQVRVEPYKIQLYGGGGHFKAHRDTPEQGLVGTFLVGLGDTKSGYKGGDFHIGNEKLRSDAGNWVAFHPDVPHSVEEVSNYEYRAVLAFKIFRDGELVEHEATTREAALQQRVGAVINEIPAPYGIFLEHKYHIGVQGLNGFDAIMLSAAQQRQDTVIHIFPVLISTKSEVHYGPESESDSEEEDGQRTYFVTRVVPFTTSHVDFLLATDYSTRKAAETNIKIWEGVKDVPFYSRTFESAADCWQQHKEEIGFTGNESDGERESSIYLSYALLVLPSPPSDS